MTSESPPFAGTARSGIQLVISVTGPVDARRAGRKAAIVPSIGSTLDPRQTTRLPAIDTTPVSIRTERSLEPTCHVEGPTEAASRCRHRRRSTARSRSANKVYGSICTDPKVGKRLSQLFDEGDVDGHVRKALPLNEQNPLANTLQVGKPHEVPFSHRSDINQHRRGIGDKRLPGLVRADVSRIARIFVK